ncbi:MAG: tetratricopeptide repeat protein [Gammaproteobacteria bacterium]|nr:MAG: tetratricopeptide repeat protein [Gammaproteobacteria bacterium]
MKNNAFVINLASSKTPLQVTTIRDPALARVYISYAVKLNVRSNYPYRLRMGFFTSESEVDDVLSKIKQQYPDAWKDKARPEESEMIAAWNEKNASDATVVSRSRTSLSEEQLTKLMEDGRVAMVAKQYNKAIRIYTKVIESSDNGFAQEAQEYLGVARERNGQLAHAKAEYQKYLKKYPQGEDAERVQQRLTALITVYEEPKSRMLISERKEKPPHWEFFGTVLQFYDRDVVDVNNMGEIVANSTLTTNFNHNGRLHNSEYQMRTNLAANHAYDFEASETSDERITSMYLDLITPQRELEARMGRQKGRSMGVVGRFDGFDLGYHVNPQHKVRLITGFPYEQNNTVEDSTDKHFYSLGYEWIGFKPHWDANVFLFEQQADGLVDRKEVGGEVRYRTPDESFFSLFDYSTEFSAINYLMMVYNRRFEDRSALDVIADYRKSPFLTTSSALQGQVGSSTLADLMDTLTEDEIAQLAVDRTATYKSLTVLHTRPLNDKLEFNADIAISNLSDTTASGGVEAIEGTGNEYTISAGLIANNLLSENDINIVNLRYSQLFNSDVLVLNVSARYRLQSAWRINPRLRIENREYDDGRSVDKLKPSVKLNYRRNRSWEYEMELSLEDKDTTLSTGAQENESSYFIHLGYIYSF